MQRFGHCFLLPNGASLLEKLQAKRLIREIREYPSLSVFGLFFCSHETCYNNFHSSFFFCPDFVGYLHDCYHDSIWSPAPPVGPVCLQRLGPAVSSTGPSLLQRWVPACKGKSHLPTSWKLSFVPLGHFHTAFFPFLTYVRSVFPAACQTVKHRKQKGDVG